MCLLVAACGSDGATTAVSETTNVAVPTDSAATNAASSDTTSVETTSDDSAATTAVASADGEPVDSAVCITMESPNGDEFTVTGIEDDDADGGLVVRADPGPDSEQISVLPEGTEVTTSAEPADCVELKTGDLWWNIVSEDTVGWVNSRYLQMSAEQAAASLAKTCVLYDEVKAYDEGGANESEFVPESLATDLDRAIGSHPTGVSAALAIVASPPDSSELFLAFETITGYLGSLCEN